MASTIQLSRTAQFAASHAKNTPLMFNNQPNGDPLLTMADWTRQFLLAPPFAWRWNRAQATAAVNQGQQDFTVDLTDFGWLEKGVYVDPTGATFELKPLDTLSVEGMQGQPSSISVLFDEEDASVTFRVFPPPAEAGQVIVVYQKSAPTFQSASDTWAPIPDYFSYLYTQGMLAKVYEYMDDPRAISAMQIFIKQVIGANEALSDVERSVFIPEIVMLQRAQASLARRDNLGDMARGLF